MKYASILIICIFVIPTEGIERGMHTYPTERSLVFRLFEQVEGMISRLMDAIGPECVIEFRNENWYGRYRNNYFNTEIMVTKSV